MYVCIDILKAIAAVLITNSHYGSIWPVSALAFGGLLGDVMFFAASGFCLAYIRQKFPKWYGKRILRIYPLLWMVTLIGVLIKMIAVTSFRDFLTYFIYPTYYHFVASIMALYIVFYFLMWLRTRYRVRTEWMMIVIFLVYAAVYLFAYDKSYYHIDTVEEPMVRFLFLEAMLLGALFRERLDRTDKTLGFNKAVMAAAVSGCAVLYFAGKLLFSRVQKLAPLQILDQVILFLLLAAIMAALCRWEQDRAEKEIKESPGKFRKIILGGGKIHIKDNAGDLSYTVSGI